MIDLTSRQKKLLGQLFSPENVRNLTSIIEGSSEREWIDLSTLLLNNDKTTITVFIDGASELENSNAGIGGIFFENQNTSKELCSFSENIGSATNNEAEYRALLKALEIGKDLNMRRLNIFSDSELLVKQINLEYKVKNERLRELHVVARDLLSDFEWHLSHVRREKNHKADMLSKQALRKRNWE